MPDGERALTEDEVVFAGLAGSETAVGEAVPGAVSRPTREIYLRVAEALPGDIDKGYVRLHPTALAALASAGMTHRVTDGQVAMLTALGTAATATVVEEQLVRVELWPDETTETGFQSWWFESTVSGVVVPLPL